MLFEAVEPCVRHVPLVDAIEQNGSFYHIALPFALDFRGSGALDFALSKVGQPYSQIDAALAPFTKPKDDSQWECAEYVQACLEKAGVDITKVKSTPTAVVRALQERGATCILVQKD